LLTALYATFLPEIKASAKSVALIVSFPSKAIEKPRKI